MLKRLFTNGKITEERLANAVVQGVITEEEKQEILDSVVTEA